MSDFVHLHLHSQYSLLDGANRLGDVVAAAQRAGMGAMALTDHGNMFGAIEFYNEARRQGIKPILGMEAYITPLRHTDRTLNQGLGGDNNHLVLLAKNETGYRNLLKLTSRAYLAGFYYKPRIDHELLARHSEGLIGLSACLKGEINQRIIANQAEEAEKKAREYMGLFAPGDFYLELQDHGIPEQRQANEVLRRIARKLGLPLVASNDCHYLLQDDAEAHDVLLCIGTQRQVDDEDRMRYYSNAFYLKNAEEMYQLFPRDAQALENTVAIAEKCDVQIDTGTFHLPRFPVPDGHTLDSYFEEVARQGLEERLHQLRRQKSPSLERHGEAAYHARLAAEMEIIEKMGFPGYFLVVWDFIRHSREQDIPVGPGRGSAAGSLVSYALRITDIDPLRYDLLFERFLNPERISMPDIDIDFCMRRRGEVIQYVADLYGRDHVAQIITFGTLAAKAVIRDVGRVLGLPYAKVDRIAKLVPDMTKSLAEAAKEVPALATEVARDPEVSKIVRIGSRLEGLTRHASVHAAGVVITPQPIDELVPLYRVKKGDEETITTQWDKDVVEDLGLLKMDFLGLRTLTVIDDTLRILEQQGRGIDLDEVPLTDEKVYELFCDGRTNGVFQFESSGMKDLLRRAKPSKFEDLAAFNALYRPGALSVGMVDEYIKRKQGVKKVSYILPQTQELLEETYGVIVYQEQVMLIAVEVAGFTMAQADILRKAMGKKKIEVMEEQKTLFLDGAEERGVDRRRADELWNYIEPFAGYGFNKSHSVAYAMLAYKTAYLKAHYPVAFMASMLNSELGSSDAIAKYIGECKSMGIEVLPPDLNESGWYFGVTGQGHGDGDGGGEDIRFGLGAVKGIGEGAVEAILEARRRVGRFESLAHMAREVDLHQLNHKVFECLIKSGSFDSLGIHRSALDAALDSILGYAQQKQKDDEVGQGALFGGVQSLEPRPDPDFPSWPERERLSYEKETLGFYLTGNPLTEFTDMLAKTVSHRTTELGDGMKVTVGGLVTKLKAMKIKSGVNEGRMMGRFVLEDLHGAIPVTLFANQYEQFGHLLEDEAVVAVRGDVRERGSELEMSVDEMVSLDAIAAKALSRIEVRVAHDLPEPKLRELSEVLLEHHGRTPVAFRVRYPGHTVTITPSEAYTVSPDDRLTSRVEEILGQGVVTLRYDGVT